MNSRKRSMIKTLTWRLCASCITFLLVYLVSGEIKIASGVTAIEAGTKMLAYYLHERAWEKIDSRQMNG